MQSTLDAGEYMQGELFSEHYIEDRLRDSQQFIDMQEKADEAFRIIRHIYEQKKDVLETLDESSLEDDFIKPVLAALEHVTDVQPPYLSHKGMEDIPDYALFNDETEKQAAQKKKDIDSDTYFDISIGLMEAKRWGKDLDKGRKRTPSVQIKRYLRMTTVKWGILTNGKKWRLYCKESPFSSNVYLEFDLQRLLEHEKGAVFQLFYAFFSHDAFQRVDGQSFLDGIYEKNIRFAQEVEDDLEKNVYDALRVLVEGFLRFEPNGLNEDDIENIHDNCLILLYRLLFLFYAESKELIQFSSHYQKYSLIKISGKIAEDTDEYAPLVDDYWQTLQKTFAIINRGSEEVVGEAGIPPYNGGLFNPDKHPFLEQYSIGDNYLMRAIDLLARRKANGGYSWVDYKTLQIRHLGSIYEKLLEYKVRLAEADLAVDKNGEYHEAEADEDVVVEEGELYLVTDKGERKATGSYYTPDYIVEYIVKNTVGELIDERTAQARENGESEADAILDIKVLDPAMGSGHFLVGAVEYMADELVEAVNRDIENEVWDNGERDHDWAKRAVVGHCIYGVDLNPLAVELAKLSLWLTTLSEGKPLSFLDHRLKCGNSLIGEDLEDLPIMPGEERKQDQKVHTPFIDKLVEQVQKIEEIPDDSLSDIKQKEELFRQLMDSDAYKRIKMLADARTAIYFGAGKDHSELKDRYKSLAWEALMGDKSKWEDKSRANWVKDGMDLAQQQRFFHWELEFPEVFFEEENTNSSGFDVVIGNPPYVRQEQLGEVKPYLKASYVVYNNTADLYSYFIEQGVDLLQKNGIFSYIVSNKWMRANYGQRLRKWLKKQHVVEIRDFGDLPVFKEATTYPCIIVIRNKDAPATAFEATIVESLDFADLTTYVNENSFRVLTSYLDDGEWTLVDEDTQRLLAKIQNIGISLEKYVDEKIYRGILTGLNKAFIIDESTRDELIEQDPKSYELIKPFLKGKDINRYQPPNSEEYLVLMPSGWTDEQTDREDKWKWLQRTYPAIAAHLEPFAERAKQRYDQGEYWWELRACSYYPEFEKPKIMLPDISKRGNFTFDADGKYYCANTAYIIGSSDKYLLGILNSKLVSFFYENISSTYRGGYLRFIYQYLEKIPIQTIDFSDPEEKAQHDRMEELVTQMLDLYEQLEKEGDKEKQNEIRCEIASTDQKIDELIYDLYGLTDEEIKIIEESFE